MDIVTFQAIREKMEKTLLDKEMVLPLVEGWIKEDIVLYLSYLPVKSGNRISKFYHGETAEAAIDEAWNYLNELPDAKTARKNEWRKNLAKLVEEGRALNLSATYMNPLEALMEELSTNILEDQR